MAEQFSNLASTTLTTTVSTTPAAGTSETWTVGSTAAPFPQSGTFRIRDGASTEIMLVTAVPSSTTWTVTRGAEGTTPTTHASGVTLTAVVTADALRQKLADYLQSPLYQSEDQLVLKNWKNALSKIHSSPVNLAIVGDSVTEGSSTTADRYIWWEHLSDMLQRILNPAGCRGGDAYSTPHGALYSGLPGSDSWTLGGTATRDISNGFGRRSVSFPAAADYIERVFICDRFWVLYTQQSGGTAFDVLVDGSTVASAVATANATKKSGRIWDSGPITYGLHTIRVKPNGAGTPTLLVDGVKPWVNDGAASATTGRGVRVWAGGYGGLNTSDFVANTAWSTALDQINPALTLIELGTNDYNSDTTAAAGSLATMKSNLTNIRSQILTQAPNCDIGVVALGLADTTATVRANFEKYMDALVEWAEANNAAVFDLRRLTGHPAAASTTIISSGVHPSNAGSKQFASEVCRLLTGATADKPTYDDLLLPRTSTGGLAGGPLAPWNVDIVGNIGGSGVLTGLQATATTTPSATVNVSTGQVLFGRGEQTALGAATTVTIASGDTYFPRIDVVYCDTGGNVGVVAGTPHFNPRPPATGFGQIQIAYVFQPPGSTVVGPNQIQSLSPQFSDNGGLAVIGVQTLIKRLGSDFTATNTTTLADVSGLSLKVAPSDNWVFKCYLRVDGPTANDIKLAFTWPAGATVWWGGIGGNSALAGTKDGSGIFPITTASDTTVTFGTAGAGVTTFIFLEGTIQNSTTAGTLQLRAAQATATAATSAKVYAGSVLEAVHA